MRMVKIQTYMPALVGFSFSYMKTARSTKQAYQTIHWELVTTVKRSKLKRWAGAGGDATAEGCVNV